MTDRCPAHLLLRALDHGFQCELGRRHPGPHLIEAEAPWYLRPVWYIWLVGFEPRLPVEPLPLHPSKP